MRGSQKIDQERDWNKDAAVLLRRGFSCVDVLGLGGTRLSALLADLTDGLTVVALENLLVLDCEKVGFVKRMVCGLLIVREGTAADGRGPVITAAEGGAVIGRRCGTEMSGQWDSAMRWC
jgi:hypothetical protein